MGKLNARFPEGNALCLDVFDYSSIANIHMKRICNIVKESQQQKGEGAAVGYGITQEDVLSLLRVVGSFLQHQQPEEVRLPVLWLTYN